jgi:hypothetical protein
MSRFSSQVNERLAGGLTGNPIPGVTVYVYEWDYPTNTTGALTALTDDDLVTPLPNPLTTDEFGQFYFNASIGVKLIEYWFGGKLLYREQIILTPAGFYPGNDAALRADLAAATGYQLVGGLNGLINADGHRLIWGSTFVPAADGASDSQAYFLQTQPAYVTGGSLGALYAQRLATYTGGAASDAAASVIGASRAYNQIAATVTYAVECGLLAAADNYSYTAQGVGVYGQTNTRRGGRGWGAVLEINELPEIFTAIAGQTVFAVPNGFNAVAAVTKNGALLTLTTHYTVAGSNVTLVSGATAGDIIKVYRGNPALGQIGTEVDCFAGPGTDTANATSGNRLGLGVFGYRQDKTITVAAHIGTLLGIISDPTDTANLTVDRGVQFQGHFGIGIDFTAANASFDTYLIKFPQGGIKDSTLLQLGDNTNTGRIQVSAASGAIYGSDTNTDVIFTRQGVEKGRFNGTGFLLSTPLTIGSGGTPLTKAVVFTPSITPASVAAATVAEQTFTVTGLTTADKVIVNPPAIGNATGIAGARVSAADTLALRFVNPTAGALTPTSGTYAVIAIRS